MNEHSGICIITWRDTLTIGVDVSTIRVAARAAHARCRCAGRISERCIVHINAICEDMQGVVAPCIDWSGSQDVNMLHHDHGYNHRSLVSHPEWIDENHLGALDTA